MSADQPGYDFDANPDFVARYDRGPPLFVPGYRASHLMAAAVLGDRIGQQGRILVIGAGGGVEIAAFSGHFPGWRYAAADPSRAMLDLAAARMASECPDTEVAWIEGVATDAPEGPFDAATAFLCLGFVPDDGTRLEQLRAIHARLKPGAPFLMISAATDDATRDRDFTRYALHARLAGAEEELIAAAVEMQHQHLHILTREREEALLREAGFVLCGSFYQGLWVLGWEASA